MRAPVTRPKRLALGIAVLTAAALGTVSASAAQASGTSTTEAPETVLSSVSVGHEKGNTKGHEKGTNTGRGAVGFAVAYHPTSDAPDDVNTANDHFAACMKDQGQSVFPDFEASQDAEGHVLLNVRITGGDFNPTTKSYKKAIKTCAPTLKKVGITFPNPADLPPLPAPGNPGDMEGSGTVRST